VASRREFPADIIMTIICSFAFSFCKWGCSFSVILEIVLENKKKKMY